MRPAATMIRGVVLLVLWLFLREIQAETDAPRKHLLKDEYQQSQWYSLLRSSYEPLARWLEHLRIDLPNQSFEAEGIFHVHLEHLSCSHFALEGIDSVVGAASASNSSSSNHNLNVSVHQVSAACSGSYAFTGGFSGQLFAIATAANQEKDAMNLSWALSSSRDWVNQTNITYLHPTSFDTQYCNLNLQVVNVSFSGSTSANIFNLFADAIASYVSRALQDQMCGLLPQQLDPYVTQQLLPKVNEWLEQWLETENETVSARQQKSMKEGTSRQARSLTRMSSEFDQPLLILQHSKQQQSIDDDNRLLDFKVDTPVLFHGMDWINRVLFARHLNHGLVPHAPNMTCHCGWFWNGWNGMLYNKSYSFPLPPDTYTFKLPLGATMSVQLSNLTVESGPDWFTHVELPHVTKSHVLETRLSLRNVTMSMPVILNVHTNDTDSDLNESFVVRVTMDSLRVLVDVDLALLRNEWSSEHFTMDIALQLIRGLIHHEREAVDAALKKLRHSVERIQVTTLDVLAGLQSLELEPIKMNNVSSESVALLEEDLDRLLNNAIALILSNYKPLVTATLRGVIQGPARKALNEIWHNNHTNTEKAFSFANAQVVSDGRNLLESAGAMTSHEFYNFTDSLLHLNAFLNRRDVLDGINQFIDCMTKDLGRWITFQARRSGAKTAFASFQNIGKVRHVSFLEPQLKIWDNSSSGVHNDTALRTVLDYDSSSSNSYDAERPSFIVAATNVSFMNLTIDARLEATIDDVQLQMESFLRYDLSILRETTLLAMLQHAACAVGPTSFSLTNLTSHLGFWQVKLQLAVVDHDAPIGSNTLNVSWDSIDEQELFNDSASILKWATQWSRELSSLILPSFLRSARETCEYGSSFEPREDDSPQSDVENDVDDTDYTSIILILGAVIVFTQPAVLMLQKPCRIANAPAVFSLPKEEEDEVDDSPLLELSTPWHPSLSEAPKTPRVVRIAVPVMLVCTMVLLVSSNVSIGASVDLVLSYVDDNAVDPEDNVRYWEMPGIVTFSLFHTAQQMLDAQVYPLYLLVVMFSGVWPYVKLILLMVCWFTPTNVMGTTSREQLLLALDSLGKFSLVDTFVLVLMVVAFRLRLGGEDTALLDVFVAPKYGFYSFLIATSLTLVGGHVVVYWHRQSILQWNDETSETMTQKESILSHVFQRSNSSRGLILSRWCAVALGLLLLIVVCLIWTCLSAPSFVFEMGGLTGVALGATARRTEYSVLSLGRSLVTSVQDPASSGMVLLLLAYYGTTVMAPFCALFILVLLLTQPLSIRQQWSLVAWAEIANAWSAIEVLVLAIFASLLEISTFAKFMLGNHCDPINYLLTQSANNNTSTMLVDTCYAVSSTISSHGYLLLLAVLLNSTWVSMVLRLAHLAVEERLQDCVIGGYRDEHPVQTLVERLYSWKGTRWMVLDERRSSDDTTTGTVRPVPGFTIAPTSMTSSSVASMSQHDREDAKERQG